MESSFAIIVSLMLDESFVRSQIAHSLLDLRNKFGFCHCTITIQLDMLEICFRKVEREWDVAGDGR